MQMQKVESDWQAVLNQDVAQLNDLMRKNNILAVGVTERPADESTSH
jgi:hypothetical protein